MPTDELIEALNTLKLNDPNLEKGRFGESYLVDRETGNKYILPTKRPDGTFRKQIKEERQVYVPLHRRNNNKLRDDNFLKHPELNLYNNGTGNVGRSSKKTFQETTSEYKQSINTSQYKNNSKLSYQSKQNNDKGQGNFNSHISNNLKNSDEFPPLGSSDNKQEDFSNFDEKKLKNSINNTLKKIREVKTLQNKLKNGADLDPNQLKKVNRMPELEQRLKELKLLDRWDLK